MKTLYLTRHAKSSWDNPDLRDFERPLNNRGKRDAPFMGKLMKEKYRIPDLMISSPAVRAFVTAKTFAEEFDYPVDNIQTSQEIYDEGPTGILALINKIDKKYDTAMLFGHNPALTSLCNYLSNSNIDNIPTCAVVAIEFDYESWEYITHGSGRVKFFEYPKMYKKK
jgi:phosphohistidine phosphatase